MTTPILQFQNNAVSTLANSISPVSTSISVAAGDGSKFPNPVVGTQTFVITLIDSTGAINEIVVCTARSGDVLTVVRAQEGTSALSWASGSSIKMLNTAGTQQAMIQIPQAQAGAYKFAVDTGSVNGYVAVLSPAITTRIAGLEANILASNANTGASTLNIGAGSIAIVNPDGTPIGSNAIVAGGVFTVIDTGSGGYQLISASQEAQATTGQATTGDMKVRPTAETITGWVKANATTIGNASSNATQLANASASACFAWHWNNFSNTQCPVFTSAGAPTSRGANAAADFAANKQIQVYDMRGRAAMGVDTMGGAASTFLAGVPVTIGSTNGPSSVFGENLHTLTNNELANHFHGASIFDQGHTHTTPVDGKAVAYQGPSSIGTTGSSSQQITAVGFAIQAALTGVRVNSSNGLDSTFSDGGGASHNTVPLSAGVTFYIKL